MQGFLFFLGSIIRWPALKPKDFLLFHVYLLLVYGITFLSKSISINTSSFVFTVGMISPIFFAIYKGIPLDCLNYKSAIDREITLLK